MPTKLWLLKYLSKQTKLFGKFIYFCLYKQKFITVPPEQSPFLQNIIPTQILQ